MANILNLRIFLILLVVGFTVMVASACLCVFIWVRLLHLPYPIPLAGFVLKTVTMSSFIPVFWFQFPVNWRKNSHFCLRAKNLLLVNILIYIMDTERFFFLWIFHVVPLEFQWIIALFMPLSRELNAFCLTKLSKKIVGNRDGSAEHK